MAAQHPLGRYGTRASVVIALTLLGLGLASPTAGAAMVPPPGAPTGLPATPAGPTEPLAVVLPEAEPSTTTTSSTSSTTTTTSSTTTTSTTVPDPALTPPQVLSAPDPIAVEGDPTSVRARSTERGTGTSATGAELPFTGSGTVLALASAFGALALGALALWWGSRKRPEVDAPSPEPAG